MTNLSEFEKLNNRYAKKSTEYSTALQAYNKAWLERSALANNTTAKAKQRVAQLDKIIAEKQNRCVTLRKEMQGIMQKMQSCQYA